MALGKNEYGTYNQHKKKVLESEYRQRAPNKMLNNIYPGKYQTKYTFKHLES